MKYYNVIPNLLFLFHLDTLPLAKSVLSNTPLPPKFKLKTLFKFLAGKSMDDSGLEAHTYISGVKATALVLKCNFLWSKRHYKINPIDNILTKN